jgi:hypothetical protein
VAARRGAAVEWLANPDLLEYLRAVGYTPQMTAPVWSAYRRLLNNNDTDSAKEHARHAGKGRFRKRRKDETPDTANKRHRRAIHWIRGLLRLPPPQGKRDTADG